MATVVEGGFNLASPLTPSALPLPRAAAYPMAREGLPPDTRKAAQVGGWCGWVYVYVCVRVGVCVWVCGWVGGCVCLCPWLCRL